MDLKKTKIDEKMLNVVDYPTFCSDKVLYNNTSTAIEKDGIVYPVRTQNDSRPGMYNSGVIDFFVEPKEDVEKYSADNVINMSDSRSISELMEKQGQVKELEREILTNPDTIYKSNVSQLDTPAMRGLKESIDNKEIDLDKYKDRFGSSFTNDKRNLKSHDITLFMLNRYTKALDIKATLTLEDRNADVPNPMGKKIVIDLSEYDD